MKLEEIYRVKNGVLIHDGDCHFWGQHVCTCGLLHSMLHMRDEERKRTLYPKYHEDLTKQHYAMDYLLRNPPPPMKVMTDDEVKVLMDFIEQSVKENRKPDAK